jgi:SAM-dependent methyltransferase
MIMSQMNSIVRNLRLLFGQSFDQLWQAQEERLEQQATQLQGLLEELDRRLSARADAYETAVDARIEDRLAAIDRRLDEYQTALDRRLDEYQTALDGRIEERLRAGERATDARIERFESEATRRATEYEAAITSRLNDYEQAHDARSAAFEEAHTTRSNQFETALDGRLEDRFRLAEERLETRLVEAEGRLDEGLSSTIGRLDQRFDQRTNAIDSRLDDRFVRMERYIDERYHLLEQRTDGRLETHERTVDGKLHQRSQDLVDRTDLMLQIFEQRIDRLRRELSELGRSSDRAPSSASDSPPASPQTNGADRPETDASSDQLQSFRKLAESGAYAFSRIRSGPTSLYEQIISWKTKAQDGIMNFTPEEQEMADYILSFLEDPKEIDYVRQHLRRFVSTLQRIPPAAEPSDRLLELGSLIHLAPAIRKYCGYREVAGADVWEGDEKVIRERVAQRQGGDEYIFELRNFDVERDTFPYPDGSFRTVLSCELIEHLQRDPMHMLWECNRVLRPGGHLLLTTPNIASCRAIEGLLVGCTPYLLSQYNRREVVDQHNREYAPYEIGLALAAAGFTVVELETEDVWTRSNPAILDLLRQVQITTELRGDNIFALARKSGAPVERYPVELYTD